jgi:hypothetical protein
VAVGDGCGPQREKVTTLTPVLKLDLYHLNKRPLHAVRGYLGGWNAETDFPFSTHYHVSTHYHNCSL